MKVKEVEIAEDIDHLFIISDLHSFYEPLTKLNNIFSEISGNYKVIAGGDYFYAGYQPKETIDWVRENADNMAVLGNHDEELLAVNADFSVPSFKEAGARALLSDADISYVNNLPSVLNIKWHGKIIRVLHGHKSHTGEEMSWSYTPSQIMEKLFDPACNLIVSGHTHYPYVKEKDGILFANCGSTSQLILGLLDDENNIISHGDEPYKYKACDEIYSTYLSVSFQQGKLNAEICRFDYNREDSINGLKDAGFEHMKFFRHWITTGEYLYPLMKNT